MMMMMMMKELSDGGLTAMVEGSLYFLRDPSMIEIRMCETKIKLIFDPY